MRLKEGNVYFVADSFFEKIKDPYLKINYADTKRPHYFAFQDTETALYWLVPLSSKVEKYKIIIQKRMEQNKPTDGIKIVRIQGQESALLFQDMFPITDNYITEPYIRGGQPYYIADPETVKELEKSAHKVVRLIHRGIKITPTQPDVLRIEQEMLKELEQEKPVQDKAIKPSIAERMADAVKESERNYPVSEKANPQGDVSIDK